MATHSQTKTFSLYIPRSDDDAREVEGRMKAVRRAKTWSRDTSYPVRVERDDGCVKMTFNDGMLVRYRRDTR